MVLQERKELKPWEDRGEVSIDTLSFTLDLGALSDLSPLNWQLIGSGLEAPEENNNHFLWFAFQVLVDTIFGPGVFRLADKFHTGRNFFRNSIALENKAGFLAFGGNNVVTNHKGQRETRHERIQFYISGEGCRQVPDWNRVYEALTTRLDDHAPRITRCDIAYDDHDGRRDVDYARDSYKSGLFAGNGRPPKGQFIDDMGSDDGRTFYVGSRDSGRYLRVYEKGKQLGDRSSAWVRWEVELSAKQCDIPLRALIAPSEYLAGSYPCLDWISEARVVIETRKKRETIEFRHLVSHGRRAYGSLVNYMKLKRGMSDRQIVDELIKEGLPQRLVWTTHDHVEPELPDYQQSHEHLYSASAAPWVADADPQPVDELFIDWEQKRKNHWSTI